MADYRIRIPIEADSSKLRSEVTRSKSALDSLKGSASQLGQGISSAGGPLGDLASGMSGLTVAAGSAATIIGGVLAGAVAGFIAACKLSAVEISKVEVSLAKTEAILRATGNASGFTTKQMDEMARSMAMMTLASTDGIRSAQNVLLTFKSITGPQFQKTIEIAQDMAAVFGGDATSAATKLGKALEDPATGLTSLREVGVSFTAEQKNLIMSLQQTGQAAKAQAEILKVLEGQVGGAGKAEAGGIAGAVDTLNQRWGELLENFGAAIGLSPKLVSALSAVSGVLGLGADALKEDGANQLFERRLELITELAELEAKPGRGRQSRINNLRQEINELGDELAATVALENAETARQAAAMEASAAAAAAHSARLIAAAAAEAAAAREKQDKADLIKLTEQMKVREQELVAARDKSFESFEKIRASLLTEVQKENESYDFRIEALTRFGERNLAFAGQANEAIELEKKRHEAALTAIEKEESDRRLQLAEIEATNRQMALGNMMTNLASLMNSKSRKMFEIGKAAAIADTVINTGRAAMGAYAALAPIPIVGPALAVAAAGAAVLAGAVQIQQIKAQQFGGGGTVSAGGGSSAPGVYAPPQPTQPYGPAGEKDEGRAVNLIFNGNINGFDIAGLAEQLGSYINQSDTIFIDGTSRTGLQFATAI